MTIVKELNDLAEKMTGTNPNKKTIAKVLDYIEQNYTAGGGSSSGGESSTNEFRVDITYEDSDMVVKTDWAEIDTFLTNVFSGENTKIAVLYDGNNFKTNIWQRMTDTGTDQFLRFISFEYEGTENSGNFLIYVYDIKEAGLTYYTRLIGTEEY